MDIELPLITIATQILQFYLVWRSMMRRSNIHITQSVENHIGIYNLEPISNPYRRPCANWNLIPAPINRGIREISGHSGQQVEVIIFSTTAEFEVLVASLHTSYHDTILQSDVSSSIVHSRGCSALTVWPQIDWRVYKWIFHKARELRLFLNSQKSFIIEKFLLTCIDLL